MQRRRENYLYPNTISNAGGNNMIEITNLKEGNRFQGKLAVRSKETPRDYKNKDGKYFFMVMGNVSGNIPVKYWGGSNPEEAMKLYGSIGVGDVFEFAGDVEVDRFSGELSLSVNEGAHMVKRVPEGEIDIKEYLPQSDKDLNTMFGQLDSLAKSVEDEHLSGLLASFFGDAEFVSELKKAPSAVMYHHNYIGGLLEHTLAVATICDSICSTYPSLNRDMLMAGAILHDVGKLNSYVYRTCIDQSDIGKLLGHVVLGDRMVQQRIEKLQAFPLGKRNELSHIIMAHHARSDDNIPKRIKTVEACALHYADQLDGYVKDFLQAMESNRQLEDKWVFDRTVGHEIYLNPED
jgi:3'-5' exoribonuclease